MFREVKIQEYLQKYGYKNVQRSKNTRMFREGRIQECLEK